VNQRAALACRQMRLAAIPIFLLLTTGATVLAAPQAPATPTEMVRSARAKAVSSLYEQVSALPLGKGITVADLLRHGDRPTLMAALDNAEQIGEPRWIDDRTCQVRLEIAATQIAQTLRQIVLADPARSPITVEQLDRAAGRWSRRTFTATGSVTIPKALTAAGQGNVVAPRTGPWRSVTEDQKQAALQAAREDAARQLLQSIGQVSLPPRATLQEVLAQEGIGTEVRQWLVSRPVSRITFRDSLQVEVWLAVRPEELLATLRRAIEQRPATSGPAPAQWQQIADDLAQRMARPVGVATVAQGAQPQVIRLPRTAPDWADSHMEATGYCEQAASKLKAARQAEADARLRLRGKLESLPLTDNGLSVGQAAAGSPQLAAALDRALVRARVLKTQYSGNSARVWLDLDLGQVWDELRR